MNKNNLSKIPLCFKNGTLNPEAVKWMSYPFVDCELYGWGRRKKWVYWGIMSREGTLGITIADVDYFKLGCVFFATFNNSFSEELGKITFSSKSIHIPNSPFESATFSNPDLAIEVKVEEDKTSIEIDGEIKKKHIHANIIILRDTNYPTLNVVVPWNNRRFQFTSKQLPFPAIGEVNINNTKLTFSADSSFACLDYGAGKWKYKTAWNWLAGTTITSSGNERIAINLGAKWTDNTGQNENGIWIGNNFKKINENVTFSWNPKTPEKPWIIRSKDVSNIELILEPFFIRRSKTNLILLKSEITQVFGEIKGTLRVDNDIITLESAIGWAEEHNARW